MKAIETLHQEVLASGKLKKSLAKVARTLEAIRPNSADNYMISGVRIDASMVLFGISTDGTLHCTVS